MIIKLRRKQSTVFEEREVEIAKTAKPFVIADVSSNWKTLKDCIHSVSMAKAAGADAVKFQLFDNESLYGIQTENQAMSYAMPIEWVPLLKQKADACDIEFMCSAFSPDLATYVNQYVNIHKVASAELTHVRLLETIRDFGKPVILSTGASGQEDIRKAVNLLSGVPTVLMYCVAAYPARAVKLKRITQLERFGCPVGFSDHTVDYGPIPVAAVRKGACVIEKHMTDIPEIDTPDRLHSLTVGEFKTMVARINGSDDSPGQPDEETDMILKHNRRLICTKAIKAREQILENVNMGIYRSLREDTKGMSPWAIAQVHGKVATHDLEAGDSVGPQDYQ